MWLEILRLELDFKSLVVTTFSLEAVEIPKPVKNYVTIIFSQTSKG